VAQAEEEIIEPVFVAVVMAAMTRHATVSPERLTQVVAVVADTRLTTVELVVPE